MATKRKREAVTVSFHYLARQRTDSDDNVVRIPITQAEFDALVTKLKALKKPDLDDETVKFKVIAKRLVPIENVESINTRKMFGLYRAAYWGHAYENTAVGKIPADSISLRPFYFILYLSDDGKIFLGVQYLGQFGSYEGLKNTIISLLDNSKEIVPHSYRQDSYFFESVEPSEVHVKVHKKSADAAKGNSFSQGAIVTFKKPNRDPEFSNEVKKRLIPVAGTDPKDIRKAASEIVREGGLVDVTDEDIEDCTVVASVNGRRKTIYLMGQGAHATPFAIHPPFNADGHPLQDQTKVEMEKILKERIIAVITP